ncbi:MAG: glycosyltransferase family 4 protein [Patescibacteria group bacterium]|nr:glycosyltransferase family 4 protein [Patescibacteria group bacterium]
MKVIYLSSYNIPTKNALGIQITQMCKAFADKGVEVELIVPKQKDKVNLFKFYNIKANFKIKEISRPSLLWLGKIGFLAQTLLYLLKIRAYLFSQRYDFVYTREQLTGLFFKNFIYEIHNFPKKITFFHKIIFKRIFKVVAITSFLKKDLIENGVLSDKILVASDAVDLNKFNIKIPQKEARNKLNLPQDKNIIGYIGKYVTFGKGNKGVDDLIKAFPEVFIRKKDSFLLIVGVGEDNVSKVKKLLEDSRISKEDYKIIAHLPYDKVIYSYRASDVLIMNYSKFQYHTYYTSPMKMFEYMASKRPIVASDLPAMREVLNDGNCLFIQPDNVGSLIKGIKDILQNKDKADRISQQAYSDVQNYTWDKRAQNILNFINKHE